MTNDTATIEQLPVDRSFAVPASAQQVNEAAEALRGNGFTVHVVDSAAEARDLVADLLPTDRAIFTATSETLRACGIAEDVDESGRFRSVRAEQATWDLRARTDEVRRIRSAPDVVVGSVQAVTGNGELVVVSASGSQLAPYASGAAQAVWVVGAQKIVPDLSMPVRSPRRA